MPFLDRVNHWADVDPQRTALRLGEASLSYAQLRAAVVAALPDALPLSVFQEPTSLDLVVRLVAGLAGTRKICVLDPGWPEDLTQRVWVELRSWWDDRAERISEAAPTDELSDGPEDSIFLIGLTSGTSGTPKGFARNRGSWRRSFEAAIDYFDLREGERMLIPGPLSASLNLYSLAEGLYAGATIELLSEFSVAEIFAALDRGLTAGQPVERIILVPTMLSLCAGRALVAERQHSPRNDSVRTVVSSGAKLSPATMAAVRRWLPQATVYEYYGASELGFLAAGLASAGMDQDGTAVGTAFPGVELAIRDPASSVESLPAWIPGVVHVRSELGSEGYLWGHDDEGFRRQDGWMTVGDLGYLTDQGVLHILGRQNDMLLSGGHNVYPHEVERALCALSGIADAVVAGIPDAVRGDKLVAGVLPRDRFAAQTLTSRDLKQGLARTLAGYKIPVLLFELSEMPWGTGGKPQRGLFLRWVTEGDDRVRRIG
ncbi:AMP-binding protein [Psychromicrobium xiongbiense]|uniref:AMP-binding protein n=1 Tax=Psychromicrobium xiongbiense TaxID=3051184 RepID=UPI002557135B|nr:AMP-binding protein [Psychromicrobium sp. YIM S02556]